MMHGLRTIIVLFAVLLVLVAAQARPAEKFHGLVSELAEGAGHGLRRQRRQFDFTLSADHDDKEDETEVALEAIASLWRSNDGNTQVDGSAKVIHRSNSLQSGNTRYSARLHVHHDYRRM